MKEEIKIYRAHDVVDLNMYPEVRYWIPEEELDKIRQATQKELINSIRVKIEILAEQTGEPYRFDYRDIDEIISEYEFSNN